RDEAGVLLRVDHRHTAAERVGDVSAVEDGVHPHSGGAADQEGGRAEAGAGRGTGDGGARSTATKGGQYRDGRDDDRIVHGVDHRHIEAVLVGDGGAAHRRVHPYSQRAAPHGDGGAQEGVGRGVDHAYVVAASIGDVGAVDRRVHAYSLRTNPHRKGG